MIHAAPASIGLAPANTGAGAHSVDAAAADERAPHFPILWHSNAPWVGTGYGAQSALFAPLINEQLPYRVTFSAFYGLKGSRLGWVSPGGHPYVVYPAGRDAYGNDVIGAHAKHWFKGEHGMVITLTDPWVLEPKIMARIPTLAWTPVDHDPLMPRTLDWFRRSGAYALAMSRFGQRVMAESGISAEYVPHGFDPTIFYPSDRRAARASLGISQDAFLVAMVAANRGIPSRKGFAQAIQAFAEFQEKHPQAVLYLHTQMESHDGESLHALCAACNVRPMMTDQYGLALGPPPGLVARIMNAADVLLAPSWGEGFGVPLLEAQACGTPVITTDFSASPEVAPAKAGNWNVQPARREWTGFDSWQMSADHDALVHALHQAYTEPAKRREARRAKVVAHAEQYEAQRVLDEFWEPVLKSTVNEMAWRRTTMERF